MHTHFLALVTPVYKRFLVINTDTRRGAQIIVEDDYPVKYKIYDVVKGKKKAEE